MALKIICRETSLSTTGKVTTTHLVIKKRSFGEGLRTDVKEETRQREDQPQHSINARRPCLYFT